MAIAAIAGLAGGVGVAATSTAVFGLVGLAGFGAALAKGQGLSLVSSALMHTPSLGAHQPRNSETVSEPTACQQ